MTLTTAQMRAFKKLKTFRWFCADELDESLATLEALGKTDTPGSVEYLSFVWPEEPKDAKWHPPEISPIVKIRLEEIRQARKEQK